MVHSGKSGYGGPPRWKGAIHSQGATICVALAALLVIPLIGVFLIIIAGLSLRGLCVRFG
jgi:hypothetical protein